MLVLHRLVVFDASGSSSDRAYCGWQGGTGGIPVDIVQTLTLLGLLLLREMVGCRRAEANVVFGHHPQHVRSVVVRQRVIDYDVLVRRNRKRNVDTVSTAVTVFVAGCNYGDVTSSNSGDCAFLTAPPRVRSRTRTGSDGSDPWKVSCNGIRMKILVAHPACAESSSGHLGRARSDCSIRIIVLNLKASVIII